MPPVRGRLTADAPIGPLTWFRVGGPAEVLFRPADAEDLAGFLAALPRDVPVTMIGVGSNLLVRDGGISGVVVRLGRGFAEVKADAGAGRGRRRRARPERRADRAEAGVAGLEFLSGIPGTIGGGFQTNAGAYGSEFKDVLISADAHRPQRRHRHTIAGASDGAVLPPLRASIRDWIFIAARFRGDAGDPADDRPAHGPDPGGARGLAADSRAHRRLDLRQPAGPPGMAADRRRRLPRPDPRRRDGFARSTPIS